MSQTGQSDQGREEKPVYLNAKQIAARYGVSRQWAYHSPDIAHLIVRIGKRVLWKLEDLEALEAESKERSRILALYRETEKKRKAKRVLFDIA